MAKHIVSTAYLFALYVTGKTSLHRVAMAKHIVSTAYLFTLYVTGKTSLHRVAMAKHIVSTAYLFALYVTVVSHYPTHHCLLQIESV